MTHALPMSCSANLPMLFQAAFLIDLDLNACSLESSYPKMPALCWSHFPKVSPVDKMR